MRRASESENGKAGNVMEAGQKRRRPTAILPTAVYRMGELADLLSLPVRALRTARRERKLPVARVGNAYLILGQWVLDWIGGLR